VGREKREERGGKREERREREKREESRGKREEGSGKRDRDGWTDGLIQSKFRRFKYSIMERKKRNETKR
jgi:hypothetical protein